jgi:hypothetical protein
MEIGEVRMSFANAGANAERAENISRLALEHVGRLVSTRLGAPRADVGIDRLNVPPVNVSFETMGDEAIALASAEEIYRALLGSI